jgi:hypothetical protein
MIDSVTVTSQGTFYGLPLEVIDTVRPDELARYIAETDEAPPDDPTIDDSDIDAMSVEEIEDELYRLIFGQPAG